MMMIRRTATFKRNYKVLKKKHYDMTKINTVIELLLRQEKKILVRKYNNHALNGNLQSFREMHVGKNWLLVYRIDNHVLELE